MPTELARRAELHNGDRMSLQEFFSVWERIPDLKRAELIDGVVHLPSPVYPPHGFYEVMLSRWLDTFAEMRGGVYVASNISHKLLGNSPQPDLALRSGDFPELDLPQSPPLLLVEVTHTSRSIDLGPKLDLYRRAKVPEYICLLVYEERVEWRVLEGESYRLLAAGPQGILRSPSQPGLWLDTSALFPPDRKRLLATLQQGIASTLPR